MSTAASLREAGHDTVHLRDQGLLKMKDSDILRKASSEERITGVTLRFSRDLDGHANGLDADRVFA